MTNTFQCPVDAYRQFESAEPLGWHRPTLEFSRSHTGLVVMHAWQPPAPGEFPGWIRAVPYLTTARLILREVFPPLLSATRAAEIPVFHVPGLYPPDTSLTTADPTHTALRDFRQRSVFPGSAHQPDIDVGFSHRHLAPEASPLPGEAVVEDADALHAACSALGLNHLIYVGFALNWCLLMSPAGMVDMRRRGYLCSTIAEATVAVESHESAPHLGEYRQALWRVAVEFGFVFHLNDFVSALPRP